MADKAISDLTAASALNDADLFLITQSAASKKLTGAALKTYAQDGFTVSSSSTLTNKTVNLTNNALSGTLAQFNTALSDADFVTIAGAETLTSKSLTTPILTATASGTTAGRLGYLSGALTFGDGTTQQSILTTVGNTWTFANSTTLSAASTKTLTLNGGGGSNGLVLDASNNVGIGTASPVVKLDVLNASNTGTSADNLQIRFSSTNRSSVILLDAAATAGGNLVFTSSNTELGRILLNNPNGSMLFVTGGTYNGSNQKLTLDPSGNLGLGVTPSAWDSGYSIFQAGSNGSAFGGRSAANTAYMMSNSVRSGSAWKYINTAAAAQLQIENGIFYWFNAPSGTAGNAISFTQAMTLDSSGNLVVGDTSGVGARQSVIVNSNTGIGYFRNNATSGITTDQLQVGVGQAAGTGFYFTRMYATVTTSPGLAFGVRGDGAIISATLTGGATTLSVDASGFIIRTPSDRNLKINDIKIPYGLAEVVKMRPVIHEWTEEANMGNGKSIGFIAQEIEEIIPEVVSGDETKSLDYPKLTAVLAAAIQELTTRLETLEARIN